MIFRKRARLLVASIILLTLSASGGIYVYWFSSNTVKHETTAYKPVSVDPAENHYWNSVAFYKAKKYSRAISAFQETIAINPHFENAYKRLLDSYTESQTLDDGQKYFNDLAAKYAENPYPYFALGVMQSKQEAYDQAITNYKKSIRLQPQFASAYAKLVEAYQALNQLDEAQRFMNNLAGPDSTNAFTHYGLALVHVRLTQWDLALACLKKALALKPDFLEAHRRQLLILRDTGNNAEALQVGEAALKITREKNNLEMRSHLLVDLSNVFYFLGDNQRALDSLNIALQLCRQFGNRDIESSALNAMGICYRATGEFPSALEHFRQALMIDRERGDKEGEGIMILNIGDVYSVLAAYDSALYYYEQSLKLAQAAQDKKTEAATYSSMANVYFYRSQYRQAIELGELSLLICRSLGDKNGESNELGNLGTNYMMLEDYPKALSYLQEALALSRALGNQYAQHIQLGSIGGIYNLLGDYERASINLEEARQIARDTGDKISEGSWTAELGTSHLALGDTAKALERLEKALEISVAAGVKHEAAITYANLATILTQQGKYEIAATNYEKAQRIQHEIGNRYGEAQTQNGRGILYSKIGEFEKAIALHQNALLQGEKLLSPKVISEAQFCLGEAYEKLGKFAEALSHYQHAIETIESVRGRLLLEKQKSSFLASKHEMYERLVGLLCNMSIKQPQQKFDETAFEYVERAKARALLDLLLEAKIDASASLSADLQAQQKAIFDKIASLQAELLEDSLAANKRESLAHELQRTEEKAEQLRLAIRQQNPNYAELQYPVPLTLPVVQQSVLRDNSALLEYALGAEASYLWVITKARRQLFRLAPAPAIRKKVRKYLNMIGDSAEPTNFNRAVGRTLYELLLEPASELIGAYANLIIVPDDTLHYLPFEALITSRKGQPHRYLVETHTVNYAPSVSVLAFLQKQSQSRKSVEQKDLLALGDPVFGKNESADLNRILYRQRGFDMKRLPYSGVEIQKIAAMFPTDKRATYVRAEAKEERVKTEALDQYRLLHFATHAWVDENLPGRSCIVLALDDDPAEDGFLMMNEVFNLKLQADLVVLSACQTGRGKLLRGEGLIGLSRAFFYAGARSLMASLWKVDDQSTAELMVKFYDYLKQGQSKSAALRLAKCDLIKGSVAALRHPHYWAPFVLMGEGE